MALKPRTMPSASRLHSTPGGITPCRKSESFEKTVSIRSIGTLAKVKMTQKSPVMTAAKNTEPQYRMREDAVEAVVKGVRVVVRG